MSDLRDILPSFPTANYAHLISVLEKYRFSVTDLLVLESAEIGKHTQLPLLDLQRLANDVLAALHEDLGVLSAAKQGSLSSRAVRTPLNHFVPLNFISTLSPALDAALGGGIPAGYVTEVTGESGAGKTQFLLSLLLAVQLPPPHGLGRSAIYISTEAPLATTRLDQILASNPMLKEMRKARWADGTFLASLHDDQTQAQAQAPKKQALPAGTGPLKYPSLDAIVSTHTPDLESQEHILTYQVPVEVSRRSAGLLVLDSVAANYRAEFDRHPALPGVPTMGNKPQSMGARANDLYRLGFLLRHLAVEHRMAVVVSNQVADRIYDKPLFPKSTATSSLNPLAAAPAPTATASGTTFPESPLATRSRVPLQQQQQQQPSTVGAEPPSSSVANLVPCSSIDTSATMAPPKEPNHQQNHQEWADSLLLDHQQRFFTGWGDDPDATFASKTPSLGLVWSTQVACRIALIKIPNRGFRLVPRTDDGGGDSVEVLRREGEDFDEPEEDWERDVDGTIVPKLSSHGTTPARKTWRRWMKVVFAPHVGGGQGLTEAVEFDITTGGLEGKTGGDREGRADKGV